MKKLIITTAIILGLAMTSFADPNGGGLFQRGDTPNKGMSMRDNSNMPMLPSHNQTTNQNAPLGTGIAVLVGLGAAYLIGKKRSEE